VRAKGGLHLVDGVVHLVLLGRRGIRVAAGTAKLQYSSARYTRVLCAGLPGVCVALTSMAQGLLTLSPEQLD
jgi:hypothetical protein